MAISGNLETISIASVLQLLCNEKQTGTFRLKNGEIEYQLIIHKGDIIYAVESKKAARLGQLLLRDKIVTHDQLKKSLALAKKEKLALGKILVQKEFISSETLEKYIYKQVEEIIFNLFLWDKGDFDFREAKLNLKWLVVFKHNIMKLILDASRRVDTMWVLAKHIPSDTLIFHRTKKSQADQDKKLDEKELRILKLIDGSRSVREIINKSGYDDFVLYRILYSFISAGLVKK